MNMTILLLNIFVATVMAVQLNFYFNSVIGKENSKPNKWRYSLLFMLLNVIYLSLSFSWLWSSILALVIIYILSLGYVAGTRVRVLFSFIYSVLITLVNTICLFMFKPNMTFNLEGNTFNVDEGELFFVFSLLLSCTIMFAVILIISLIAKRRSYSLHLRYFVLFLLVPFISIYQVNFLTIYSDKNIHYYISIFGYIVLNVLIIFILDTVISRFQLLHQNALLQRQMDYQDANYEKTVHSFKKIKSIIHDTNQQFLYVNECIEHGKLEEASHHIKLTLNMIEHAYHKVNTGNLAIDALLTNALNISLDNGIRMDTELHSFNCELPIERYDLCIVLGNMLDNAIEASKKVKVGADRYIRVQIRSNETALLIRLHNRVDREVVDLKSSKARPEYHGFGLMNIKRICEKYGGHMTIETDAHSFDNLVVLPFNLKNSQA